MVKKISLFFILFLFAASISYADDISISYNVDQEEIAIDEQLTLTIIVNGTASNIPNPQIPALDGFTAYSSGRSQNISIINGKVNSAVSFNYILVPTDVGEYTLGPFTIDYKGKVYSAGPVTVNVLPRRQARQSVPYESSDRDYKNTQDELFIETYVDKLRAYVNEQITLTFAFYQAVDLFENPVYAPATTTGFWTEDMPPQKKYYKVINGVKYLVTEIKTALFATSPGEFTIGSARLEASVEDLERYSSRNFFDIFDRDPFSMFRRGKPVILTTDPILVEILPLPEEGKPSHFKGDVGSFNIIASIDKESVEENQPITLKIKIEGKGNIKTISSPALPEIDQLKLYDSGSSENISKADYMVQGEKTFEKVIIPKTEGNFSIGPIEYSYFDPREKIYITKTLDAIMIEATKSEAQDSSYVQGPLAIPGLTKEEVKLLKKDIRYIKSKGDLAPQTFLYKNRVFLAMNLLPLFLLVYLYIYELHRQKMRTDVRYARSRGARRAAAKKLKKAKSILAKGDSKEFYAEIYRAVIEYIADKLNIPHPSITKDLLEEKLGQKGFSKDITEELKDLFDTCDMARFAAGRFTKEDLEKSIKEAADIIEGLEGLK